MPSFKENGSIFSSDWFPYRIKILIIIKENDSHLVCTAPAKNMHVHVSSVPISHNRRFTTFCKIYCDNFLSSWYISSHLASHLSYGIMLVGIRRCLTRFFRCHLLARWHLTLIVAKERNLMWLLFVSRSTLSPRCIFTCWLWWLVKLCSSFLLSFCLVTVNPYPIWHHYRGNLLPQVLSTCIFKNWGFNSAKLCIISPSGLSKIGVWVANRVRI